MGKVIWGMTFGATLQKVLDGTQTQARRPVGKRNSYYAGKIYGVQPHVSKDAVAFIKITSVREQLLGAVTEADAQAEGYPDLATFKKSWVARFGSFEPTEDGWKIEFKLVDKSEFSASDLYKFEEGQRRKSLRNKLTRSH